MEGEAACGADLVVRWQATPDNAGGRRRSPHRRCADDDLHRPASAGVPSAPAGPAPPGPTDAELAARIAAGDIAALALLYDRYSPQVFALALAIVGERPGAEDVLIEAYYRLWRDPAPPAAQRRPIAGRLLGLARDLAAAEVRRRGARMVTDDGIGIGTRTGGTTGGDPSTPLTPAVAGLPDDQRRALALAYFDGLSEREIAERLGRSVGQVRLLLRLGFERLRAHLDGAGAGAEHDR